MTTTREKLTSRYRRGLVVGKFCPLHRGHEMLIRRAVANCDDVVIISYTKPEFGSYTPLLREAWIKELFPQVLTLAIDDDILRGHCARRGLPVRTVPRNDASDAVHREFVAWLCLAILGLTVDAVFTSEEYGDGFAAALTAYFSGSLGKPVPVSHVCVDRQRLEVPVSGTAVRAGPHAQRDFLSPVVYASHVERICFLGGESSGKTTLAAAAAKRLDTLWVAEYGRELWETKGGRLDAADMLTIAREQVAREAALARQARRWLFCDTSPLTTLFYSLDMFGAAAPELFELAKRSYAGIFLCAPDFAFVQDGTRRDQHFRTRQHEWYLERLASMNVRFTLLSGSVEARLETVAACLRDGVPEAGG
jgi:NadR type nicotinamide-nucleotide adenylyltransferase